MVFLVGAPIVVAMEAGITALLFAAENNNPFRTEPIPAYEYALHFLLSVSVAIAHLGLAYMTACILILTVRERTFAEGEELLDDDFPHHTDNPDIQPGE